MIKRVIPIGLAVFVVIMLTASFAAGMWFGTAFSDPSPAGDHNGNNDHHDENNGNNDGRGSPQDPDQGTGLPGRTEDEIDPELLALVRSAAERYRAAPVDAVYNSTYHTVIPELNGYQLDQQATLSRLAAAPGSAVTPLWEELRPTVTAADYPTAIIDRGNPGRQEAAFMINVAWGNEYLPEMLEILEQHDVRATFFIVGRWAERFPDLLQEIHRRGHELANHGYDDGEEMPDLDYAASAASLRKTNEAIKRLTGQQPRYFTPHKGEYSSTTREVTADLGMRLLLWTLDTVDWQRPGEEVMARRILDNLIPGAIILMHPTEQSAGFLRLVLPEMHARGYRIVTINELLSTVPSFPQLTLNFGTQ